MEDLINQLRQRAITERAKNSAQPTFTKEEEIRLEHELKIIKFTETAQYFNSFIKQGDEAKSIGEYYVNGHPNCSFLLYCTNTITINPLTWNLPFELFINPIRIYKKAPLFEIVFEPKEPLTEEELSLDLETVFIRRAIAIGQLAKDVLTHKNNFKGVQNISAVAEVLKCTEYNPVWQEQLMELLHRIGGFCYAEADIVRRMMLRNDTQMINQQINLQVLPQYLKNAVKAGYDGEWAKEFFCYLMAQYSDYRPPKAHYIAMTLYSIK